MAAIGRSPCERTASSSAGVSVATQGRRPPRVACNRATVADGTRPCFDHDEMQFTKDGQPLLLFHEYYHGETGRGLGASHQTGWTGVIAKIIQQLYVTTPDVR